jgi:hypothetical protein
VNPCLPLPSKRLLRNLLLSVPGLEEDSIDCLSAEGVANSGYNFFFFLFSGYNFLIVHGMVDGKTREEKKKFDI